MVTNHFSPYLSSQGNINVVFVHNFNTRLKIIIVMSYMEKACKKLEKTEKMRRAIQKKM